jgi:hypothetical protein
MHRKRLAPARLQGPYSPRPLLLVLLTIGR